MISVATWTIGASNDDSCVFRPTVRFPSIRSRLEWAVRERGVNVFNLVDVERGYLLDTLVSFFESEIMGWKTVVAPYNELPTCPVYLLAVDPKAVHLGARTRIPLTLTGRFIANEDRARLELVDQVAHGLDYAEERSAHSVIVQSALIAQSEPVELWQVHLGDTDVHREFVGYHLHDLVKKRVIACCALDVTPHPLLLAGDLRCTRGNSEYAVVLMDALCKADPCPDSLSTSDMLRESSERSPGPFDDHVIAWRFGDTTRLAVKHLIASHDPVASDHAMIVTQLYIQT